MFLFVTNLNQSRSALTRTPKFYNVNFEIFTFSFYSFRVPLSPELAAPQVISARGSIRSLYSTNWFWVFVLRGVVLVL